MRFQICRNFKKSLGRVSNHTVPGLFLFQDVTSKLSDMNDLLFHFIGSLAVFLFGAWAALSFLASKKDRYER